MTFLMLPVIIWSPKCEINKSKLIPYKCLLPFHLWHITGCTIPLIEYISDMVDSGVSLRQIDTILVDNRLKLFYALKEKYPIIMHMRVHLPREKSCRMQQQ